ncbi:sugar transferase [Edaphobacter albus]|uniref:sugar transferase n=1 Tax=Edaphobacter sp. 4G125 TaxID=2763071 RepID=UPI0016453A1F|nr:sugar transferase [Edaphobacter sp. 4G125]QNI37167.1 sugar transferase [Edaphobacter sp. 4G125]
MQAEFQSPESRMAAIEDSYSFTETVSRPVFDTHPLDRMPAELFRYRVVKRFFDIFMILVASPIVFPLMGLVSLLVMISSPGPIFYSHRRIRRHGAFFSMWKFRTMCVNSAEVLEEYLSQNPKARAEWNRDHKLRHDPRITPIGSFLRRYSVDEFPQLWNVLAGHMSLVGPRPIVAAEVEKYEDSFECYCRVRPGLTGLWQVSGRSELTYDERVALDCDYVNHWSLRRDLKILLKTFKVVLKQDGAY